MRHLYLLRLDINPGMEQMDTASANQRVKVNFCGVFLDLNAEIQPSSANQPPPFV